MGQKKLQKLLKDPTKRKEIYKNIGQHIKKLWEERPEIYRNSGGGFSGKHHTEETKNKIRERAKLRTGERNSLFGRLWVYNELV